MNFSMLKNLLFLSLLMMSLEISSASISAIRSIVNLANCRTIICNKSKCDSVSPQATKQLGKAFVIPFVSIKKNLKEFVKDIPFAPANALRVSTKTGNFFIWKNESGIVCAPDPKNAEAVMVWKLKILLDSKNINLSNLALEIDKDGNFEVKQQLNLPKGTSGAR